MKFKVIKPLIYSGTMYNSGDSVEILENEVIERAKNLGLVEVAPENVEETEEQTENAEENLENSEEKTDNKSKNKKK